MNFQITVQNDSGRVINNKFMYVKQNHLINNIQNIQSKVLINPNFVHIATVKPHFNKQFLVNQTIHVNPHMLKRNDSVREQKLKNAEPVNNLHVPNKPNKATKPVLSTPTKLIRVPQNGLNNSNNLLLSTRTKLVRVPKQKTENTHVRRTSIHTKYKIIRHPPGTINTNEKKEENLKKLYYIKNHFRIDHRSPTKKSLPDNKFIRRFSISHKYLNTTLKTKNVYVKCNSKLNKTPYMSINGILYKRSSKSLVSMDEKIKNASAVSKNVLLTIRGQKYKLDSNHRTLTLVTKKNENVRPNLKTIYLGRITFKQTKPNIFVKTNTSRKHLLLSQAKQKSIRTLTNRMKKSNIPCPFYRKFGKCKGKDEGTCVRIHNPDQISLCPKFLQGLCINDHCLLSHKVSAEKMPTCKFFLEGLCSKDNCPYLHVKISINAEICKDFLEGFCKKATECDKRHQYLCPSFEKSGSCTLRRCPYPHGTMVRKAKLAKIASKLQSQTKCNGTISTLQMKVKNHSVHMSDKNTKLKTDSDCNSPETAEILEKALTYRYYDESNATKSKSSDVQDVEIVDLDLQQNFNFLKPRPKVGELPSFIPFFNDT